MRKMRTVAIVLGAMLAVPMAGLAATAPTPRQTNTAATARVKTAKAKATASHSARGVVKTIDANTLVIERGAGKNKKEMTFALDAATHRTGDIAVGSTVSVRYKNDASKMMALDIQPAKVRAKAVRKSASR